MSEIERSSEETSFRVNDLDLKARRWRSDHGLPVLAIHGWMDNAASFDALARQMPEFDLVALDLAGNGLSEWRSGHGSYNIWDDFIDILAVADDLGWEKFHLIGHSRGAIASFMLTSLMPDRIESLTVIDGMLPFATDVSETTQQMRQYLLDQKANRNRGSREYDSFDDALEKRRQKNGLTAEECLPILQRGMKQSSTGKYVWTHDPRIQGASAVKLTESHIQQFIVALQRPTLMIAAEEGMASWAELLEIAREHEWITAEIVPGGHHLHMSTGSVSLVAEAIRQWQASST